MKRKIYKKVSDRLISASLITALCFLELAAMIAPLPSYCGTIKQESIFKTRAKHEKPLVIAHRGGKTWAPENTMAAFSKCLDNGVDAIELDIHRAKSGELVVIHDESLERTTNGAGLVGETDWSILSKLSAGAWFSPEFANERIPRLEEVLALIDGKLGLNIEIKNSPISYAGIEDDLIRCLSGYAYPNRILVSSFDHQLLKRFHEKCPDISVSFLGVALPADIGTYALNIGANAWNPGMYELRADCVQEARDLGISVNVWTVNGDKDWTRALSLGVDGIITDDPQGLIRFLSKPAGSLSGGK